MGVITEQLIYIVYSIEKIEVIEKYITKGEHLWIFQ